MRRELVVAGKEIRDHARDGRSLVSSAFYALLGPLVVVLLSLSPMGLEGRSASLAGMTAVFALVAAFVGGMNVAMDAVAGERERRSLVPLLVNPVRRRELVVGKWIAVSGFGLAGLVINLAAFGWALGLPPLASWAVPIAWRLATWALVGLVPLVLLAAAVEIAISAFCRNTKEAHTYLSILIFVPMMTGMFLVFFPAGSSGWRGIAPVAGQYVLLERALDGATGPLTEVLLLGLLTLSAAGLALWAAARLLGRDDVVLGGL